MGGEGGDILLDQRTEDSFVNVPYKVEVEATGVGEAATEELKSLLIVCPLYFLYAEWVAFRVVGEEVARDGVTEEGEGVSLAGFELADGTFLPSLEGFLVTAYSGKLQVEELHEGLEVFLRGAT